MESLGIKAFGALFIFLVSYVLIATEKVNKTIVVIIGASLALFFKLVSFRQAVSAIDFNVIFLLVGMMTCVHVLSKTGFFEWVAISIAKRTKGSPMAIMLLLLLATSLLSAFLDNVTTIVLLVPVTILITEILEISPLPFIMLEAISSNIGGTSTLIGDPPNIIIGSQARLSFNDFLCHLGVVISFILGAFLITVYLLFRKRFQVPENIKKRVTQSAPALAIVDKKRMKRSLIVMGFIFVGFFLHNSLNVEPGIIALFGSMVMLLVCKSKSDESLTSVEWGVIFFFIGMFMIIAALEYNGVIVWVAEQIIKFAGNDLLLLCVLVLWGSAVLSSVLDNIPFVITMVPLVKQFVAHFSSVYPLWSSYEIGLPIWWSLALGACLGGNGTLIGASANIVMAKIAERNHYHVTFRRFLKYGSLFMLQSMLISTFYIWFRYFYLHR